MGEKSVALSELSSVQLQKKLGTSIGFEAVPLHLCIATTNQWINQRDIDQQGRWHCPPGWQQPIHLKVKLELCAFSSFLSVLFISLFQPKHEKKTQNDDERINFYFMSCLISLGLAKLLNKLLDGELFFFLFKNQRIYLVTILFSGCHPLFTYVFFNISVLDNRGFRRNPF